MPTIISPSPVNAVGTASTWRNKAMLAPDGYRLVLRTDGSNLILSSSQTGTTWVHATVVTGTGTIDGLVDAVVSNDHVFVFVASGTGCTCYSIPYTGSGGIGSITTVAALSSLPYALHTIRAVYDPAGTTLDTQHIAGTTGIIHLLVDAGATWYLYAFDPHSTGGAVKLVTSGQISTGITSPTYNTNLIVRKTNTLFAISPTGTNWVAYEIAYSSATGTTGIITNGTASWNYDPNALFASGGNPGGYAGGNYEWAVGQVVGGYEQPRPDVAASTWGATFAAHGPSNEAYSYPAGTWEFDPSSSGIVPSHTFTCRVYEKSGGGGLTLRGTIPSSTGGIAKGTLGGFTMAAGSSIYIEPVIDVLTDPWGVNMLASIVSHGGYLHTPTPTYTASTTTTVNTYSPGVTENPALGTSGQYALGADLCPSNATTNPGLDVFINNGKLATLTRYAGGGYSALFTFASPTLQAATPCASSNSTTGDEQVIYWSGSHIFYQKRVSGAWGASTQLDASATSPNTSFIGASPNTSASMGIVCAFVNGSGTFALQWNDAGQVAAATTPTKPTNVQILDPSGAGAVFGSTGPFNVTRLTGFTVRATYNNPTPTDQMAAYRLVNGAVDSGKVGLTGGPVSAQTFDITGQSFINGAQSVQLYTWDSLLGNVSPVSDTVTVTGYTAPAITAIGPSSITSSSVAFNATYTQAQGKSAQNYRLRLLDGNGLAVHDTGLQAISPVLTSGSVFTTSLQNLQHEVANLTNYTIEFTFWATPTAGAPFTGIGTALLYTQILTPPVPTDLSARAARGVNPLDGGYVELAWMQATGSPAPVKTTLWQREHGTTTWSQAGLSFTPIIGRNTRRLYSVANRTAYDFGLTTQGADGYDGPMSTLLDVSLTFRLGLWLNDPTDPKNSLVELGMRDTSAQAIQWDPQQHKNYAELWNTETFRLTTSALYARKSGDVTYTLENGWESDCLTLLEKWDATGTTLQIRDNQGKVLYGTLEYVKPTHAVPSTIKQVLISLVESNTGYGLLAV